MRIARVHLILMILIITLGCTEDKEQNDGIIDQGLLDNSGKYPDKNKICINLSS